MSTNFYGVCQRLLIPLWMQAIDVYVVTTNKLLIKLNKLKLKSVIIILELLEL